MTNLQINQPVRKRGISTVYGDAWLVTLDSGVSQSFDLLDVARAAPQGLPGFAQDPESLRAAEKYLLQFQHRVRDVANVSYNEVRKTEKYGERAQHPISRVNNVELLWFCDQAPKVLSGMRFENTPANPTEVKALAAVMAHIGKQIADIRKAQRPLALGLTMKPN